MHFDYIYEDILIPGSPVVYTKCISTLWIDVGLLQWIHNQFVARDMNFEGELVGPLRCFDGNGDELIGKVIDLQLVA